jgi:hypothetical protein
MIRFTWVSGHLYAAIDAGGDGGCLLFFLPSASAKAPAELTADEAWDPTSAKLGTFLFVQRAPQEEEWAALDAWAMARLAAASVTQSGFAWVSQDPAGPALAAALPLGRDAGGAMVEVGTSIPMPLPLSGLSVPVGLRAAARTGTHGLEGVTLLPPPLAAARGQPASGALNGIGLALPLSGPLRGCFAFEGVYNSGGEEPGPTCTLDLYEVTLDPLVPWGGRTAMTIAGVAVVLSDQDGAISLAAKSTAP